MGWYKRCAVAAVLAMGTALTAVAAACVGPVGASGLRQEVTAWINEARRANGLAALRVSSELQSSATAHACAMADSGHFGHNVPGEPTFTQRLKRAGFRFRAANENIAYTGSTSVAQVTTLWRESGGHWANVLDPKVREVGVGIAQAGGRIYWVTNSGTQ